MVTHGVPGVAFGAEPLDPSLMRHPSPAPARSILDRALTGQIAFAGLMVAAVSLLSGVWAAGHDADVQTAVFLTLGLGQLSVAVALRAPRSRPAWRWRWHERGLEVRRCCSPQPVSLPELWRHRCRGCSARRPLAWPASSSRSRWRRFRGSHVAVGRRTRHGTETLTARVPWHLCARPTEREFRPWSATTRRGSSHGEQALVVVVGVSEIPSTRLLAGR